MVSIKSLLIATLVSSVISTPIESSNPLENDLEVVDKVPVIEVRGNGGNGGGYGAATCDYNTKQRLDNEINNRYQLKSRLDDEIGRRQAMKQQLDNQINLRQGQLGHC
ncbi:hypothetical protein LZ31DRAFT_636384 [Colletotrichum somersetense]|nr:hypothetical protein LZ31DRAFT_636384 [Colletotrichum somersetense]